MEANKPPTAALGNLLFVFSRTHTHTYKTLSLSLSV